MVLSDIVITVIMNLVMNDGDISESAKAVLCGLLTILTATMTNLTLGVRSGAPTDMPVEHYSAAKGVDRQGLGARS